jgi:hypothetical protein
MRETRTYPDNVVKDVIQCIRSGDFNTDELSKLSGVKKGTLSGWMSALHNPNNPDNWMRYHRIYKLAGIKRPDSSVETIKVSQIPTVTETKNITLDQFLFGLESLICEYKKLKRERESYQNEVKRLQVIMGKMNEDIQQLISRS